MSSQIWDVVLPSISLGVTKYAGEVPGIVHIKIFLKILHKVIAVMQMNICQFFLKLYMVQYIRLDKQMMK